MKRVQARAQPLTARTADRRFLYELAVQSSEAEMDFVSSTFKRLRGRPAKRLREDFCGTAISACEWVRRGEDHTAVALDLDAQTLRWGAQHNVAKLPADAQRRISLLKRDVRAPGKGADRGFDAVLAMNFSYWCFRTPTELRGYFESVRRSLASDGVFFLDIWGGYESMKEQVERRRVSAGRGRHFTYVWEQSRFDPITGDLRCHISFEFPDKTKMSRAFTYDWRLWTVPQVRELLADAGFLRPTVYWEGDDGKGGGNGVFRPRQHGEADASFIAYMSAEK